VNLLSIVNSQALTIDDLMKLSKKDGKDGDKKKQVAGKGKKKKKEEEEEF